MILTHVASLKVEEENDVEEENKEAFLISCTTGNNRTGCLIAIILSLLGVSGPDISTEYELSTLGLEHKRKDVARRLVRNAPAAFGIGESPNEEIVRLALQRAERVAMARKESMEAMLLMVREKWGSVDGYARDVVGLDPNESGGIVERCREVMCVNASSVKKNRG